MRDIDLFQLALNLTPPWEVVSVDFDADKKRLDILLDFPKGSVFSCPECGRSDCTAYDTTQKTWRHLNFFQHEAYLSARVPRVNCKDCGVKKVGGSWARPDSGFTLLFEAMIMSMVTAMPVKAVARFWATHSKLEPVKQAAYTVKRHWDGILRWFHSHINNGILEGINRLIQAAKAKARGYRSSRNYITMIYLIAGKLDYTLPT